MENKIVNESLEIWDKCKKFDKSTDIQKKKIFYKKFKF